MQGETTETTEIPFILTRTTTNKFKNTRSYTFNTDTDESFQVNQFNNSTYMSIMKEQTRFNTLRGMSLSGTITFKQQPDCMFTGQLGVAIIYANDNNNEKMLIRPDTIILVQQFGVPMGKSQHTVAMNMKRVFRYSNQRLIKYSKNRGGQGLSVKFGSKRDTFRVNKYLPNIILQPNDRIVFYIKARGIVLQSIERPVFVSRRPIYLTDNNSKESLETKDTKATKKFKSLMATDESKGLPSISYVANQRRKKNLFKLDNKLVVLHQSKVMLDNKKQGETIKKTIQFNVGFTYCIYSI